MQLKIDIKGVNFVSLNDVNPASSNAFFQVAFEKKCVKPIVNATKFGKSLKCSTIITLPFGLQTLRHSFKIELFHRVCEFRGLLIVKRYYQLNYHLEELNLK